ncbi:unnamed protein product, partial [Notodromas monacha]
MACAAEPMTEEVSSLEEETEAVRFDANEFFSQMNRLMRKGLHEAAVRLQRTLVFFFVVVVVVVGDMFAPVGRLMFGRHLPDIKVRPADGETTEARWEPHKKRGFAKCSKSWQIILDSDVIRDGYGEGERETEWVPTT